MAVQVSANNSTVPFVRHGYALTKSDQVIIQDAGRTDPLVPYTLMAKISASQKWTPFILETATDGTAIPQGIYIGEAITAAALVAGDIPDALIVEGGAPLLVDKNQLVIEASKTLATVITVGTTDLRTVEDHLKEIGVYANDTIDISSYES